MSDKKELEKFRVKQDMLEKPNVFRRAMNKIQGVNSTITNLNKTTKIEYVDNNVCFTPNLDYKRNISKDERLATRDELRKTLIALGFKVSVRSDMDDTKFPHDTVYVSLNIPENVKRMEQIGSLLNFYYKRPLKASVLKSIVVQQHMK